MLNGLRIILLALILATSIPIGYLLAYLCRDELKNGWKWFRLVAIICAILVWVLVFFYDNLAIIGTLAYIGIVASVSMMKSSDKRWTRTK